MRSVGRHQGPQQGKTPSKKLRLLGSQEALLGLAKLKEKPEDKLQAVGAADVSQTTASGQTDDQDLQTRDLQTQEPCLDQDVMLEAPHPTYHELAKFRNNNPIPCVLMYSGPILQRSQEGGWKMEKSPSTFNQKGGALNKGTLNGFFGPRFIADWTLIIFLLVTQQLGIHKDVHLFI